VSRFHPLNVQTIRHRLLIGFGVLVVLLIVAGSIGFASMRSTSRVIQDALADVQSENQISSRLSAGIVQELSAAVAYLETRDSASQSEFHRLGWEAHRAQREMNRRTGQSPEEVALVARIDARLSSIEIDYALAHRLADLGRRAEASARAAHARAGVSGLLGDVQQLGTIKTGKVSAVAQQLRRDVARRSTLLVAMIVIAVLLGILIVVNTVRWISHPLGALVRHARELSHGNLATRTHTEMPGEFQELADAMNSTAESLSRVVSVATFTADDVSGSAHDLAQVSEQISLSANQMATSMHEITTGAESQVQQLRSIDDALRTIRESAHGVLAGASEVTLLAGSIEESARSKRSEIVRALSILDDVRSTVEAAANEVVALNRTAEDINKFVASVSRIAEQTDLLALNAAIEAARAGQAGRGFAVVAEEVRKLAEQAQAAADDVVQLTSVVTTRVGTTRRAMEAGASRVGEIEKVSRDIDGALDSISAAAERTRHAAGSVTEAAARNAEVVSSAANGVEMVARTAEGHAASAQQVSASTQEQSAACQQMSSASTQLLQGSTQLRELVGGLKTAVA
jgi:methyl-accepting chemotaxis protein